MKSEGTYCMLYPCEYIKDNYRNFICVNITTP